MKNNLDIVDELYSTLNKLRPLKPEDQNRLAKKFRLEFNYNSNHIEGNTLTYGETELLLIFDDTKGSHIMREYEEMKAHDVAYQMIEEWAKEPERPLNEQAIKNLNEIMLVRPYWKEAITPDGQNTRRKIKVGSYKEFPNSVRLQNGEIFEYASPAETPILMQELIDWHRTEEKELHPVTLAAMLHYKLVRIHPFDDGNGRISRLLMNYVLLKHNYPPVIIKSSDKDNYLRALHLADVGDYEPLIDYIAQQVVWSLQTSIKAAKGESLEDKDDFIKEIELIKRKAASKGKFKSKGVIYDTFYLISTNLWSEILDTLAHFDELFDENANSYSVNDLSVVQDDKFLDTLKVTGLNGNQKELKVFNYNISETNIHSISWIHSMSGLHGANLPVNSYIMLKVIFSNHKYKLGLTDFSSIIYELEKSYSDALSTFDLQEINNALKKHLIKFISKKIN